MTPLLIVPSGAMTTLPPAVLISEEPLEGRDDAAESWRSADWLIRAKALAVLPTVATLKTLRVTLPGLRNARAQGQGLFMIADPKFSPAADQGGPCERRDLPSMSATYFGDLAARRSVVSRLCRLEGTAREADQLKALLGGDVLTQAQAREANLRDPVIARRMASAQVVAFATHGLATGDLGLAEPALALALPRPEDGDDDGLLTASEAAGLRLSADWVLLSACNTARPDAVDAEGLSGLVRAFLFAGGKSLLVSHWRIDDAASATLVAETIRLRTGGASKAKALQSASLAMLRGEIGSASDASAHPAIWAPFMLLGEVR
jgi:CHAT domain-containing protein